MKVSLSWLKDYVAVDMAVADLADALTMAGLEVETVTDRYAYLEGVIVGRISQIKPHPQADKLVLCRMDTGGEDRPVVCGARNIQEGDLVPLALPGTQLPTMGRIEVGRIRGETSEGMLCSEAELALGEDASGIFILPDGLTPGMPLVDALNLSDPVVEFDLTPNRPDCLSVIGVAREVAAIAGTPLKPPQIALAEGAASIDSLTSVTIQAPDHCPRYAARVVSGIRVQPSPFWLRDRLHSVGLRAINNVVDVTNFVLMEMGQPLHAFDFDRLSEGRIVVDTAREGDVFTTLDGIERRLSSEALMICDGKGPVALAGIMGGLESEIEDETQNVLIESAYFNPTSTRRTAKRLGLSTEASYRFERGVDPEGVIPALDRTAQLICQLTGGTLASGRIDNYPRPIPETRIQLSTAGTNRLIGTRFSQEEIASYLKQVELEADAVDEDTLEVIAPSFRVDLRRPQDLMEEVARLSGYDNVATTHPRNQVSAPKGNARLNLRRQVKQALVGSGFSEIITYSFIGSTACDKLMLEAQDHRRKTVSILNPLTETQDVMRTSLIPGLLGAMGHNTTQQNTDLRLCELGKVFFHEGDGKLPTEVEMVSGLWTGRRQEKTWHTGDEKADFFDIKGVVEMLARVLNLPEITFAVADSGKYPYYREGAVAQVFVREEPVGAVGRISPQVLKNFELRQDAFCFELDFDTLAALTENRRQAKPVSRFPSTTRDIALILDNTVQAGEVLEQVQAQGHDLINEIQIFDVYKGPPIPADKKSLALRLTYCSLERSLTDEEVNAVHEVVTGAILKHFDAELPAD